MNGGRSKRLREKSVFKIVGIVLLMVLVGLMFTIVDRLPVIGNPDSAPNRHVSDYYIEEGPELTHSPNLVTGVLADFRGFDTLLETTVMFLAGVSVAMILSNRLKRHWDAGIFRKDENFGGYEVKVIMPILIPVIIVYAFYVLMHGEVSLGGGFQAGALLAMAFMLYIMFADLGKNKFRITQHFSVCVAACGVFIYFLTGVLCMINGGSAYNIIPGTVTITGSTRTFSKETRNKLPETIRRISESIAAAHGGSIEFSFSYGYASVMNDKALTANSRKLIEEAFGKDAVLDIDPLMPGEDFSALEKDCPGFFVELGAGSNGCTFPHHNSRYLMDEDALGYGIEYLVRLVRNRLS